MNEKNVNQVIKDTFENITPDVLDKILLKCDNARGDIELLKPATIKKDKNNLFKMLYGLSAMTLASLAFFFLMPTSILSTITLDVNPSIEIIVENDTVKEVVALNDDGSELLLAINTNKDVNQTVINITNELIKMGYISSDTNSILVSIKSDDDNKAEMLEEVVVKNISTTLETNSLEGSIVSQNISDFNDDNNISSSYNISIAKASLIEKIIEFNPLYKTEDLVNLSINELNLLLKSYSSDEIKIQGNASQSNYIGEEQALNIAKNYYGLNVVDSYDVEFEFENSTMIYSVTIYLNQVEYEFDIDAVSGSIIKTSINKDDNSDIDDNDNDEDEAVIINYNQEESVNIVLNYYGINKNSITNLEVDFDTDNNPSYEIIFDTSYASYETIVDALNGNIISENIEYFEVETPDQDDDNDQDDYDDNYDDDDSDDNDGNSDDDSDDYDSYDDGNDSEEDNDNEDDGDDDIDD